MAADKTTLIQDLPDKITDRKVNRFVLHKSVYIRIHHLASGGKFNSQRRDIGPVLIHDGLRFEALLRVAE